MITQEVNVIALAQAAEAVVGQEAATAIAKMYRILDDVMFAGYELGKMEAEKNVNAALDAAFDSGFDFGSDYGTQDRYDEGYVDGVYDARLTPEYADDIVAELCALDDEEDCGCGFDCPICRELDLYSGDSGDENGR